MRKINRIFLFLAAGFTVSACDAVIVEDYPFMPPNYNEGDFDLAAINGVIATIVVGDPFANRSEEFDNRVRALMRDQVEGFPVKFVPRHGADTIKPYKVVAVFNPRPDVVNQTICRLEERTPMAAAGPGLVSLIMSFCIGDRLKSGTRGRVGNVKGGNDPKFAALVQQVTAAMIPPDGLQDFIQNDKQRILN
jgi:hypothetical protein